uniref:Peptidase S9A N-terminal domain-containing protein n=1 Tax=Opuntia streptacantha TaxID=393608 RepID=A0A7C9APB4_OPUST
MRNFHLILMPLKVKRFLLTSSESKNYEVCLLFGHPKPSEGLKVLTPLVEGVSTYASHRGDHFFIKRRSGVCFNSELLACPVDNISATTVILPHRESVNIEDFQVFLNHWVVLERVEGLPKLVVYDLPAIGQPLKGLGVGRPVDFVDPVYSVYLLDSQFSSIFYGFRIAP